MKVPVLDLKDPKQAEAALNQLEADELHVLNKLIVERLKTIRSDSYSEHMARFRIGERVSFTDKSGELVVAAVIRLNKKTASLETDDGQRWNVAPQLLKHAGTPAQGTLLDFTKLGNHDYDDHNHSGTGQDQDQDQDQDNHQIEWVGRMVRMPGIVKVSKEKQFQPHALMLMDDQGIVQATTLFPEDEFAPYAVDCLHEAINNSEYGDPVTPDRIRVANEKLIKPLSDAFANIEFILGDTPELDPVVESFMQAMTETAKAPTYLNGGAEPEAVGYMFRAAADLYKNKPWKLIPHDQCLIGVSIPSMGIHDAALSVIGQQQQYCGFLLFPTIEAHELYVIGASEIHLDNEPSMPGYLSLNYVNGAALDEDKRKEISSHKWKVYNAKAYPDVFTPDENQYIRPITAEDITTLEVICRALPQLLNSLGRYAQPWASDAIPKLYKFSIDTQAGEVPVEMTIPFEYERVVTEQRYGSEAIARLLQISRASDDFAFDEVQDIHQAMFDEFADSPESEGIGLGDIDISPLLGEFASNYLEVSIATLCADELAHILFDIIPARVAITPNNARAAIESARAFYQFLKREHGLMQADTCLALLDDDQAITRLADALSDTSKFSAGKSMLTQGAAAGFDLSTPAGIKQTMEAINSEEHNALEHMTDFAGLPGLPVGESQLPELAFSDKGTESNRKRKDKRKAARKARKKNR